MNTNLRSDTIFKGRPNEEQKPAKSEGGLFEVNIAENTSICYYTNIFYQRNYEIAVCLFTSLEKLLF